MRQLRGLSLGTLAWERLLRMTRSGTLALDILLRTFAGELYLVQELQLRGVSLRRLA